MRTTWNLLRDEIEEDIDRDIERGFLVHTEYSRIRFPGHVY